MYPYNDIPKLIFNHRIVPMNLPEKIYITDTTFRDGQQARSPYTVEEICDLFTLLHKLDNGSGIIRQTEFFLYSPKDKEAVLKCQELGYDFPQITAWIRAKKEDFQLVKDMGLKETGILVSCSDYHIFKKMHWTRSEALKNYLSVVEAALEAGIVPRCHFEDITRAVVLPRSVQQIMYGLTNYSGVPSEYLEWHGHNDFYNAVPNAVTAWLYGCASINASLLGIGERTGNTPLEAMVIEYCQLKGNNGGMNLRVITDIANYFENEQHFEIPPRTPFVGRAFNATRAGIHADGLLKNEEIYNIFNTTDILGRPPIVVVDAHSGAAGIAAWINTYYSLADNDRIDKRDEGVTAIKEWIDNEYATGRTTVIGDAEMEQQVKKHLPRLLTLRESRSE